MLEARRYRRAADHLASAGRRGRPSLPLGAAAGRAAARRSSRARGAYDPAQLGAAIGGLLRAAAAARAAPPVALPRVSVAERLAHLRALLRRGACSLRRRGARAPTA